MLDATAPLLDAEALVWGNARASALVTAVEAMGFDAAPKTYGPLAVSRAAPPVASRAASNRALVASEEARTLAAAEALLQAPS